MSTDPVGFLNALSKLRTEVIMALLIGGAVWALSGERRFESERSDKDRAVIVEMLQASISEGKNERKTMDERADYFIQNQGRIAIAMEMQVEVLKALKDSRQSESRDVIKAFKSESDALLRAVKGLDK